MFPAAYMGGLSDDSPIGDIPFVMNIDQVRTTEPARLSSVLFSEDGSVRDVYIYGAKIIRHSRVICKEVSLRLGPLKVQTEAKALTHSVQ